MRMWSLLPAILFLLIQGPSTVDHTELPGATVGSSQALLATLRRVTTDPQLSRVIATLMALEPEPVTEPVFRGSEAESEDSQPLSPPCIGVARDGFCRGVRSRDGPTA